MAWKEVSEERYWEFLEVLPPEIWLSHGFLVGEPTDARRCNVTGEMAFTYGAFVQHGQSYFESDAPLTVAEFKAFKPNDL